MFGLFESGKIVYNIFQQYRVVNSMDNIGTYWRVEGVVIIYM